MPGVILQPIIKSVLSRMIMKRLMLAALLMIAATSGSSSIIIRAQSITASVRAYRVAHEAEIINEFADLLSIPNVASDATNIRRNAAKLVEMMRLRSIETRLLEGNGPPAVYGELKVPGATRTIAFYAHYDGQPVDAAKWSSEPFKPTLRDGPLESGGRVIPFPKQGERFGPEWRLYARSASDDKAPIIAMLRALDALKAAGKGPAANLKFFFDGEEEAGSPHL